MNDNNQTLSSEQQRSSLHWPTIIFFLVVSLVLYLGWKTRGQEFFTAESGLGYWLGIIGSSIMLLMLLYPARKMFKFMHGWGSTKRWFQIHWVMGIIGPVMVIFHSNFRIGSLNSQVTLYSTLLVVASGLIGRYIYTRVNYSLYGRYDNLKNLRKETEENRNSLALVFNYAPEFRQRLQKYEKMVELPDHGFLLGFGYLFFLNVWTRWTHFNIARDLEQALAEAALREKWPEDEKKSRSRQAKMILDNHLTMVLDIAEFNFYEKLLAMWHLLHFPLYILLIVVATVHIVVVHMY